MSEKPLVGIVMGSDSDLPVMKAAAEVLEEFEVSFELTVISAHRTPDRAMRFAREASARGLHVIIAGAGGAAHLPGVMAAMTELPVIGVPIHTAGLGGVDALYSIVQMPPGVPVATVAVNGAKNAGLLAVQMLGIANPVLREKYIGFREAQRRAVEAKADKIEAIGYRSYLEQRSGV